MKNKQLRLCTVLFLVCLSLYGCLPLQQKPLESTAQTQLTTAPTDGTTIPAATTVPETTTAATVPVTTAPTIPAQTEWVEPADAEFVRVLDYIPDVVVDLKYATEDNFTGQVIYDFSDAYLRYGTVKKLMQVQETLREQGLCLKIWDAFRPTEVQFKLWDVCPDPTYVSNPNNGFSSHSRGNTVDITLVDAEGKEWKMPTGFDDFSTLADRDYSDCDAESASNAQMLENLMTDCGFKGYYGEWWHFSDTTQYDVEESFTP